MIAQYIDGLVPLALGLVFVMYPQRVEKNRERMKKIGYVLIAIGVVFLILEFFKE